MFYFIPIDSSEPHIVVEDGRHPIVDALLTADQQFVPNSCTMEVGNTLALLVFVSYYAEYGRILQTRDGAKHGREKLIYQAGCTHRRHGPARLLCSRFLECYPVYSLSHSCCSHIRSHGNYRCCVHQVGAAVSVTILDVFIGWVPLTIYARRRAPSWLSCWRRQRFFSTPRHARW